MSKPMSFETAKTACAYLYNIDLAFTPGFSEYDRATEQECVLMLLNDGYNVVIGDADVTVIE